MIVATLAHRTPGPASATNAPTAPAAAGETTTETTATTPSGPAFPAPPAGAVVFSRQAGDNVIALGVVPGKRLGLQASVLGSQGQGVNGLDVSFGVGSHRVDATPCGPGCYRATAPAGKTPKAIEVRVGGKTPSPWIVQLPKQWPPPDGTSVVRRATRTFLGLETLTTDDLLSSGIGRTLHTHWTLAAPNKLKYQIVNGPAAVIIGDTRWDKTAPGEKWIKSAQTPIHQPVPFWVTWRNAHIVGETPSSYHVTFFDPKTPGWYDVVIAKSSLRTLSMRMQAAAHFMRQHYGNFNAPAHIAPP